MQKAVFMLSMRGSKEWSDFYEYRPYNWGPYSGTLVHDVDTWIMSGEMKVEEFPHSRYGQYATTEAGEKVADNVWTTLSEGEQKFVRDVRRFVTTRSFNKLLRDVYAAYPEYATKSQFNG
ncbi:hypothetical protein [Cellulomonas fengjieae]|uniref:Uncharacterized protein n=1 Tax=Cellulomonas fengjieae TaxID=2819978 RepID=A0ABS3SNT6_9CELL|nr:hypothetical protein [Cellulomonas fengjieae]MBO3086630.1 hypothetical protein [Cellulomonas fengjieae]QVI66521.1 hypothetical protein KG102_02625 [Cellulomonas fengjieae]